jgi:hypothetical protein
MTSVFVVLSKRHHPSRYVCQGAKYIGKNNIEKRAERG